MGSYHWITEKLVTYNQEEDNAYKQSLIWESLANYLKIIYFSNFDVDRDFNKAQ